MLDNYPIIYRESDRKIPYAIPFFYQYESFKDLNLCYFLGIGVSSHQIECLILDFFNLVLVTMYIVNYRNPLLFRSVKKIFWTYPNEYDSAEKWKRLEPNVLKQHRWLQKPYPLQHNKFKKIYDENQVKFSD
jgi:hypothetical protein